jgi:formamidopyrimidine-DNA glycosylase
LEKAFTGKVLRAALQRYKTPIKPTIMNPQVVVGVGNIYASESLFEAEISPLRAANSLTLKECVRLVACIQRVLLRAIEAGGSSLRDFAHPDGQLGHFQNDFYVYGRKNEQCRVCGTPIEHIVQAQRSTFYCPECQKK